MGSEIMTPRFRMVCSSCRVCVHVCVCQNNSQFSPAVILAKTPESRPRWHLQQPTRSFLVRTASLRSASAAQTFLLEVTLSLAVENIAEICIILPHLRCRLT